jgi:hypothetical protein
MYLSVPFGTYLSEPGGLLGCHRPLVGCSFIRGRTSLSPFLGPALRYAPPLTPTVAQIGDMWSAAFSKRCVIRLMAQTYASRTVPSMIDRGGDLMGKLTALEAYREGKLSLPPGYGVEHGADALLLRREEGSVVAVFSAKGTWASDVVRTAWRDHEENSKNSA